MPNDLDARMDCQIGTWLSTGPLASGVPMGASHGIGYVLGAEFGVPHGHTSCVMLPSVMRWNKSANAERQALVAAAMGHPERGRRRRARRLHSRPRHAAQPARGQSWPRAFRPHRASRRWRRPGCRATRARSRDRRRCAKFLTWPRKEIEAKMYTGKHAHLRPLQPAFIMASYRRGRDLSRAGGAQQPAGASVSQPRPEAARPLFDLHGEQQPLPRSLRRRRTVRPVFHLRELLPDARASSPTSSPTASRAS